jgi:hypothetical protein
VEGDVNEKELYNQTCGFFLKDFHQQFEINQQLLKEHFEAWKKTESFRKIAPNARSIDDVPLTTYEDYPQFADFAAEIEELRLRVPRERNELFAEYYSRLTDQLSHLVKPLLPYEIGLAVKTTGTTGRSKWFVHGEPFKENVRLDALAVAILACSDRWGESKYKIGEKALNVVAPVPYLSGWLVKLVMPYFQPVPPLELTDNIMDARRKFYLALKMMEKGEKITVAGATAALLYMLHRYFTDERRFFLDLYKSSEWGIEKFYFLYRIVRSLFKKPRRIEEVFPLKGALVGGADSRVYCEFFKNTFGQVPLNNYASSEAGIAMIGTPDERTELMPNLRSGYYEFLDEEGVLHPLTDLKKGKVYELVVTPFGSALVRYRSGDLFSVTKIRDDGLPLFTFEGRTIGVIEVYGYFRLTEGLIAQALAQAGLRNSDRWAVVKSLIPEERLHFLMEKDWDYSEKEAEKHIFNSLLQLSEEFAEYVKIFKIENPSSLIKVEYLKRGAFTRYYLRASKLGLPLGQLKAPKIIPPDRYEIVDLLKSV